MKTVSVFLILLSLFSFVTKYSLVSADSKSNVVRDIDGDYLRSDKKYYILPVFRGRGGGLTQGPKLNGTQCPMEVIQARSEVSFGRPLTFTPVDPKKKLISLSADHNIKLSAMSICVQSQVLRLAPYDESVGKYFISTDGVAGSPGPGTLSNWFKIEKDGEKDYKLVFCPGLCNFCKVICKEVGIYIGKDGIRRLALTDDTPFKIMFKKA